MDVFINDVTNGKRFYRLKRKLNLNKNSNGFALVEFIIAILIISILVSATFIGGTTVVKKVRKQRVESDLSLYSNCVSNMFYENPSYASKNELADNGTRVVDALNEYLVDELQVSGGITGLTELKDSWGNSYNYAYSKKTGETEAAIIIWSNGADQTNNSGDGLTVKTVEHTISGDDIAILIRCADGSVSVTKVNANEISGNNEITSIDSNNDINTEETWIMNKTLVINENVKFIINFESASANNTAIVLNFSDCGELVPSIWYTGTGEVYTDSWKSEDYRTVTFETAPTGDLLMWLQTNAIRQADVVPDIKGEPHQADFMKNYGIIMKMIAVVIVLLLMVILLQSYMIRRDKRV